MQVTGSAPEHETYDQTSNYIITHLFKKKENLDLQEHADECSGKCRFKTCFESN